MFYVLLKNSWWLFSNSRLVWPNKARDDTTTVQSIFRSARRTLISFVCKEPAKRSPQTPYTLKSADRCLARRLASARKSSQSQGLPFEETKTFGLLRPITSTPTLWCKRPWTRWLYSARSIGLGAQTRSQRAIWSKKAIKAYWSVACHSVHYWVSTMI